MLHLHDSMKLINTHLIYFSWLKKEEKKEVKIGRVKNEEMDMEDCQGKVTDNQKEEVKATEKKVETMKQQREDFIVDMKKLNLGKEETIEILQDVLNVVKANH